MAVTIWVLARVCTSQRSSSTPFFLPIIVRCLHILQQIQPCFIIDFFFLNTKQVCECFLGHFIIICVLDCRQHIFIRQHSIHHSSRISVWRKRALLFHNRRKRFG